MTPELAPALKISAPLQQEDIWFPKYASRCSKFTYKTDLQCNRVSNLELSYPEDLSTRPWSPTESSRVDRSKLNKNEGIAVTVVSIIHP
ncbi:hypothetical protein AVEN_265978-1 [Araneus ventricosus]|uniref:Uncharacterized protein n=1 Tax=Araneus ventricosus TaxID=182803 RepID=A0A4Y2GI33_ARAVE|nr:hypothetical protein AVEN_265978-1 [Araneus ventricosus]